MNDDSGRTSEPASATADTLPAALATAMRPALARERERAWQRLASPGTWFTGEQRLAIAAESRHAHWCALCRTRKQALSPYQVNGRHDTLGELASALVEAVHRITTDAGRITQRWVQALINDGSPGAPGGLPDTPESLPDAPGIVPNAPEGLPDTHYVEAIGVIALITALDTMDHALGLPQRALPVTVSGTPTRQRPAGARRALAWIPTVAPGDLRAGELDAFAVHGDKNIHRALSLVPQEVCSFFDLDVELYLKDDQIRDFDREYRALTHAQIELLAGRVSALNGCYY